MINIENLKDSIRNVADFPRKGIQFKDITTLLKNPAYFGEVVNLLADFYKEKGITHVVAVESRGFIVGGALASKLGAGFIPVRKPGKLPAAVITKTYTLEYGEDSLEIHRDALTTNDVVLLHDDLLATGGTTMAAIELIRQFGVKTIYANYIIELDFLKGREKISPICEVFSLLHF